METRLKREHQTYLPLQKSTALVHHRTHRSQWHNHRKFNPQVVDNLVTWIADSGNHRTHSLATALTEFQASLTPEQKDHLLALSTQSAPDANAVLVFTAQVDRTNQRRKSRCVASRLQNTLQFIQQFSGVVDTFVSADPSTAALAWGSVKVTILVR